MRCHTLDGVVDQLRGTDSSEPSDLRDRLDAAFAKHEEWLRRRCAGQLRGFSPQQVEDAVQDVLLTAWRRLPDYRPEQRFRAWLGGIALNQCRNIRSKRRDVLTTDGILDPGTDSADVYTQLAEAERHAVLRDAAAAVLDQREQEVVELRFIHAYGSEQIAEIAGLTDVDEVRVTLQRCRRRLARELRRRLQALGHSESFFRG